jgi:hypothetical protein
MILSAQQVLSDAQSVPAGTQVNSTNTIDLGVPGTVNKAPAPLQKDIGPGEPVRTAVDATCLTSSTIRAAVIQSALPDLSSPDLLLVGRITNIPPAGRVQVGLSLLPDQITKRYLGLTLLAGASANPVVVDANVTMGKQSNITVAAAYVTS